MRDVSNGWLIRYLHANTASAFFFLVYLHMGRGIYYGSYRAPRTLTWAIGTIIFIALVVTAFLGYIDSPKWFNIMEKLFFSLILICFIYLNGILVWLLTPSNYGEDQKLLIPSYSWKAISGRSNHWCLVITQKILKRLMGNRICKSNNLSIKEQRVDGSDCSYPSCLQLRCVLGGWESKLNFISKQIIYLITNIKKSLYNKLNIGNFYLFVKNGGYATVLKKIPFFYKFFPKKSYKVPLNSVKESNSPSDKKNIWWLLGIILAVFISKGGVPLTFCIIIFVYNSIITYVLFILLILVKNINMYDIYLLLSFFFLFINKSSLGVGVLKNFFFFLNKNNIDIYKYIGINVFFLNTIKLLFVGSIYYLLINLIINCHLIVLYSIILLIVGLVLFSINKNKFKLLTLYLRLKNNQINFIPIILDKFLFFISLKSTWWILMFICQMLNEILGSGFIDLNLIITILTTNLFKVLFMTPIHNESFSFSIYPQFSSSLLDIQHANEIIKWLSEKSSLSKEQILRDFDLSEKNILTLMEAFSLHKCSNDRYSFYFGSRVSYAIQEKDLKYYSPKFGNEVHIFESRGKWPDKNILLANLQLKNCKSIFIYDYERYDLFELVSKLTFVESNSILFVKARLGGGPGPTTFFPYDTKISYSSEKTLYLLDKHGTYHDLGIVCERTPALKDIAFRCSLQPVLIKTDVGKAPVMFENYVYTGDSCIIKSVLGQPKLLRDSRFRVN